MSSSMPRFKAPYPVNNRTRNGQWSKVAPPGMRSPDMLWGKYWQQFNTFPIPISCDDDYFETAMSFAKMSEKKEDFERRFEEHNQRRYQQLRSLFASMTRDIDEKTFPCHDAYDAALNACRQGCLQQLVEVLNGCVHGWPADAAEPGAEPPTDNGNVAKKGILKSRNHAKKKFRKREHTPIEDVTKSFIREGSLSLSTSTEESSLEEEHTPIEDVTRSFVRERSPSAESDYHSCFSSLCSNDSDPETSGGTFLPPDWGYNYEASRTFKAKQDNYGDGATPFIQQAPSPSRDSPVSSKNTNPSSAKRGVRFVDEDDATPRHEPKRKLGNATPYTPTPHASSSLQQSTDGSTSRKRPRPNEEEQEDDDGYKRQKIESLLPPATSPHASSSLQQPSDGSTSRKRSRPDEEEQEEDDGYKRQKIESPLPPQFRLTSPLLYGSQQTGVHPRRDPDPTKKTMDTSVKKIESSPPPTSPAPLASSTENTSTAHLPQDDAENLQQEQFPNQLPQEQVQEANNNGGRKQPRQKPRLQTSRAKSPQSTPGTRSSRRIKSSTLWELDFSGNPHSI
ncbi:hypothetical protein V8C35DRAFT_146081 [Trichoderma chlorosporum]